MRDGWIIYAIFGVLVCLLLWRVATQWKVKSAEAQNLRASFIILGVVALAFVVWQYVQQASPIAVAQDKTITVFAAASMTNELDADEADRGRGCERCIRFCQLEVDEIRQGEKDHK